MIGRTASKTISKYFNDDFIRFYNEGLSNEDFNWSDLDDFGTAMTDSIREYSMPKSGAIWWGALLLIDMLYAQKKINELTYRNIQNKYNKKQVSK